MRLAFFPFFPLFFLLLGGGPGGDAFFDDGRGQRLVFAAGSAFAQYPNRPLTLIVPWGAGGGTDAVARFIASLMEKDLGQPVNVVNRTGGSGVVGH